MLGNLVSILAGLGCWVDIWTRYVGPLEMQRRYKLYASDYMSPDSESDCSSIRRILRNVRKHAQRAI